jgi:hypothetical protein
MNLIHRRWRYLRAGALCNARKSKTAQAEIELTTADFHHNLPELM